MRRVPSLIRATRYAFLDCMTTRIVRTSRENSRNGTTSSHYCKAELSQTLRINPSVNWHSPTYVPGGKTAIAVMQHQDQDMALRQSAKDCCH